MKKLLIAGVALALLAGGGGAYAWKADYDAKHFDLACKVEPFGRPTSAEEELSLDLAQRMFSDTHVALDLSNDTYTINNAEGVKSPGGKLARHQGPFVEITNAPVLTVTLDLSTDRLGMKDETGATVSAQCSRTKFTGIGPITPLPAETAAQQRKRKADAAAMVDRHFADKAAAGRVHQ